MRYCFGDYTLDTQRYALYRVGQRVPLRPKVFQVLAYLLTHRDRVVSKEELLAHGWPGQFLSEETLTTCITAARQAVGDSGTQQAVIQTRRSYGYCFIAAVEEEVPGPGAHAVAPSLEAALQDALPPAVPTLPDLPCLRCAACQCPNSLASQVCGACGHWLGAGGDPALSDPRPVVPGPQAAPVPPGERKQVTVLAGALVPTPASATLAPEVWDTLRRQFFGLAQQAVQQYAGTMQQIGDDDFLALFGTPIAQEDHAQRAMLAALSLQRAVRHPGTDLACVSGVDLAVQTGVHTGQVMVGPLTDGHPLLALAVGDTIRVAVRLRHLAAPGIILLSAATRPWVHGVVYGETVTQGPEAGPEGPLLAYEVQQVMPQAFPWPHGRARSPFVGRDREMAVLQAVVAQVEAGHGHVVGLVGDPGMGKSRLLYEFQRQVAARSLTLLIGGCVSYGQATPYLPLRDCLLQAWELAETDPPAVLTTTVAARLQHLALAPETWAPPLLALLGVEPETDQWAALSAPQRRAQTFEALLHVSLHTSQQRPLVLAIENLHWIDPTSEAWLALLAERLARVPLLLLTTTRPGYRPPWIDKSYTLQLALPRLTAPDSRRMVQARRPTAPVPDPLLQTIIARADGNPFFLEELAGIVEEQDDAVPPGTIPETIQAVLATRLDRVSPAAKQVAQVAAVLGKEVPAPLLQAVLTLQDAAQRQRLLELQAAEILYEIPGVPASTYTFKHSLLQEVAYASLLTRSRQQVHQRVAQVLEARFPETAAMQPELLAQHYTAAGRATEAVTYWQRAGQRANERAAYVEAIAHLTKGLDVLTTLPDTGERAQHELLLQVTLSAPLLATKGYIAPEVKATYDRALALCRQVGESPQLFPAVFGMFRFALVRGELSVARELAEHLLRLAQRAADPLLLLGAHAALGATLWSLGELTAGLTQLEQGIMVSERQQHRTLLLQYGEDPGVICLGVAAWGLHLLGYPAQALARSRACVARAQELSHPFILASALVGSGIFHQMRREGERVQAQVETAITLLTAHGLSPYWLALATMLRGWARAAAGQATEGLAQLCQGLDLYRSLGGDQWLPWILALLAEAYEQAGKREEGLRVLADALALVDKTGERVYEAELYRLQGQLTLAPARVQGAASSGTQPHATSRTVHAEAERCFLKAMEITRLRQAKTLELRAALSLARLWQQQGQQASARELLAPLYGWFTEGFDTADLQEAGRCWMRSGDNHSIAALTASYRPNRRASMGEHQKLRIRLPGCPPPAIGPDTGAGTPPCVPDARFSPVFAAADVPHPTPVHCICLPCQRNHFNRSNSHTTSSRRSPRRLSSC